MRHLIVILGLTSLFGLFGCSSDGGGAGQNALLAEPQSISGEVELEVFEDATGDLIEHQAPKYGAVFYYEHTFKGEVQSVEYLAFLSTDPIGCDHVVSTNTTQLRTPEGDSVNNQWRISLELADNQQWNQGASVRIDSQVANLNISTTYVFDSISDGPDNTINFSLDDSKDSYDGVTAHIFGSFSLIKCF